MKLFLFFVTPILFFASVHWGNTAEPTTVRRLEIFETTIHHNKAYTDPYRNVTLDVVYQDPAGDEFHFWGFYDGSQTWKIRFRPNHPGLWTYTARFSDGSQVVTGTFRCGNAFAQQKPIVVNPMNPVWFSRGADPFLMRAFHIGDRFFASNWPDAKRKAFLDWAQAQGYNTLSIASHFLNRNEKGRGAEWKTPQLWPLNACEYQRMEGILDDLLERGFVVFPFAGFFGKKSNYPRDPQEQELYIRYTLSRLAPYPHLLFNVAGPEPNVGKGWMKSETVERLGQWIQRMDIFHHPLTVHNRTGDDPYRDSSWSTFGTLQGPKTVDRSKLARGLLKNHHPAKPLFAQETLWSGNIYHQKNAGREYTDDDLRKNAYVINLCAAGLCFADNQGNSSSGFSGSLELFDCQQHRHDIIKNVWDFIESIPYFEMKPRPDLVNNGFCLAQDGTQYLVYLEQGGTVDVNIKNAPLEVEWINARSTSDRRKAGITQDGQGLAAPSDGEDWLLYLRKTGKK